MQIKLVTSKGELHGICEKVVFLRHKKYIYQFIFCVCNGFLWHIAIPLYGASSLNIQLTILLHGASCNLLQHVHKDTVKSQIEINSASCGGDISLFCHYLARYLLP